MYSVDQASTISLYAPQAKLPLKKSFFCAPSPQQFWINRFWNKVCESAEFFRQDLIVFKESLKGVKSIIRNLRDTQGLGKIQQMRDEENREAEEGELF